jgi:hypothetical protein
MQTTIKLVPQLFQFNQHWSSNSGDGTSGPTIHSMSLHTKYKGNINTQGHCREHNSGHVLRSPSRY